MDGLRADVTVRLRSFELRADLAVGRETLALVGPSGSGKTTVLRAIAGLLRPDVGRVTAGGEVWLDRERGVDVPPERRSVGMVFQDYALFPHLTVRENVAFGAARDEVVDDLLERVRVDALTDARPAALSGGERQRVALARALAREPAVLLLDEPLAALDAHTRAGVRAELAEVLAAFAIPTVIVTHDMRDAAALADRAVVLARGAIRQEGSIGELVAAPADPFVASFTGANVLPGTASAIGAGRVRVTLDGGGTVVVAGESAGRIQLVVHPWELRLAAGPPRGGGGVLERVVTAVVPDEGRARVRLGDVVVDAAPASAPRVGERCWVLIDPGSARVLPAGATDR